MLSTGKTQEMPLNSKLPHQLGAIVTAVALLAACGGPRPLLEPDRLERAVAASVAIVAEQRAAAELRSAPVSGEPELRPIDASELHHGSGVVLADGYILTTADLVDAAARTLVRLPLADSTPQAATLVGVSVCDNLALLRIEGEPPRPARLGSSAELALGAPVAALGFLPGEASASPTLTPGAITWASPERQGLPSGALLTVSAAVAPGGSGGPLLSPAGEVLGIVAEGRFAAPAQGADYVIGIDYARTVAAELRAEGGARGLGLDLVEVPPDDPLYARFFGPDARAGGLFVRAVAPGLGGGIRPGDLLVAAAGVPVAALSDLCGALRASDGSGPVPAEALRRDGEATARLRLALPDGRSTAPGGGPEASTGSEPTPISLSATPIPLAPTPVPAPAVVAPAPAVAVPALSPEELEAARAALAAERARHRELFFETFDSDQTKRRWRQGDDAAGGRQFIYGYYQLTVKQPGAVVADAWPERPLGPRYIVELEVALPPAGGSAVGITFDQQTDGSGLSSFVVGADGSWQLATFQGGALVPGRYVRGTSPAFVGGGGTNFLRVVRLPEGTQLWLNDTLVARAAPGPFAGGHAGVIGIAGPEPLPQPVTLIVDNFRLLEHP
jgi:S1-C subfamily serine protease